jgi:urease accessory protein
MHSQRPCISRNWMFLLLGVFVMFPQSAFAHPGHPGSSTGSDALLSGILHPFTGLDHLLAMIAIGLWAAQLGGRSLLLVPASFVGVMTIGAALGISGFSLPLVQVGIVASVLLLGLAIAGAVRPPTYIAAAAAGLLALFHGHAHGTELTAGASSLAYGVGFVISTIALHAMGIGLGIGAQQLSTGKLIRATGGVILAAGVLLLVSIK